MRQDLDGDGRPEELALAVRDAGWEWPTGWLDRCPDGYLVVADGRGQGVAVLHVAGILIGGYGDLVGAIAARDVTGDGSPELLLRIDRTVSEVGYGGHELRVLRYRGGALDELLRDEATITMLAGVGELAWVTLDVRPGAVRRVAIRALPYGRCQAPVVADPDTATGRCLERREVTWRWDAERQRFSDPGTGAAHPATAVIARDTPLRDRPDETAPASGTLIAGAGVALERVDGWYVAEPIGGIPGHWVRVVAGDGTAGWIPSHQLVPDDAVLTAFLRGDRSATSQVVPVRWDGL